MAEDETKAKPALLKPIVTPKNLGGTGIEKGTVGLQMTNGVVVEEAHDALKWPKCLDTFNRMSYDPSISSANNTIKAFARKAKYRVVVPNKDVTARQKSMIKFIESCMHDMEDPFDDVINEALSMLTYGFSVHEKILKFRNNKGKYKSKHKDGRIGWAKLPIRSQDSIYRWHYDAKGRELEAVEQNLQMVMHNYSLDGKAGKGFEGTDSKIVIKRKRFMHFRHNSMRNNPEGTSPLKSCYIPWMYKSRIEEFQAIGISRDLGGLPVITMPPEYMSPDATDDKKQFYAYCQDMINNMHSNQQAGVIFPAVYDEITRQPLFTFDLVSSTGGKLYDTDKIISGYENKILMTYLADVLKLGQDATGSFALSDNKTNLLAVGIHSFIKEILQEFNRDLIPQTMKINGWKDSDGPFPQIELEELDEPDIEMLMKAVQQVSATGALEVDEGFSDWCRKMLGAPPVDRSKPIKPKMIAGGESKSGEGAKTAGPGTAKKPSGDKSASNKSNK